MEVKRSGSSELRSDWIYFFVGCIGFDYWLGQARFGALSYAVYCFEAAKGRRCNSEDDIIFIE